MATVGGKNPVAQCPKCRAEMPLTGVVCPQCGYGFPLVDDAKPGWRKSILVLALSGVVVFALYALGTCEKTHYSAICAKCLQHAYIFEKTCLGVRYQHKCRLSQAHGGLMSPASFSPPIPATDPKLYEAILGKPCEHSFKKGGFGRSTWFLHSDGSCPEWKLFFPRVRAVEATYRLFLATKDVALARRTFGIIERLLASDAREVWHYRELLDFAERLDAVGSVEQWERLLSDPSQAQLPPNAADGLGRGGSSARPTASLGGGVH